ncbi:MAG: hypothetical protein JWR08_2090 [Enterovirga sp.]|nr:hypothetical protein [Enterovirga sp.]
MSAAVNPSAEAGDDVVTGSLASRFRVTLGQSFRPFAAGDEAPLGLHWCLAPELCEAADLDTDGISRSGIIPSLELPRRMWAGGEVRFHQPLRVGDCVSRRSSVGDVVRRNGRSGPLAFVRIRHDYAVAGEVAVEEEQTIVYREAAGAPMQPCAAKPAHPPVEAGGAVLRSVGTDPLMLFRFSALTFNAHRIHFDRPYATSTEGHPDVLVHGTLTAALLLDVAASHVGQGRVAAVTFRALAPAACGAPLVIRGAGDADTVAMTAFSRGAPVMSARVGLRADPRDH